MKKDLIELWINYTDSNYTIELKENVKPYQAKPFPMHKIHEPTQKYERKFIIPIV